MLLDYESEKAKERQLKGQQAGGKARHGSFPAPAPESRNHGDARDKAAKAWGVGGRTVTGYVAASKYPDLVAMVDAGDVAVAL